MPGPIGKHPSTRNRRNRSAGSGGRVLEAVPRVPVPAWPLRPDASQIATREALRDKMARLQQQILDEDDRRRAFRFRRELEQTEIAVGILSLQIEETAEAEKAIWADLWERAPQAAIWAENPATIREVALYVRWMARAEQGDKVAASEARQLSNALGINPAALLKLRAEIEHVDGLEDRGRRRRERATAPKDDEPKPDAGGDPRGGLFVVG